MAFDKLHSSYHLTEEQIQFYRKHQFIKLKQVLAPEIILDYNYFIAKKVEELHSDHVPLDEKDTYGKAFLQLMNLWTQDESIKSLVFSKRMAKIATDLMGVSGVRLYHDQALFKEANGGITPWHADQYYWPLTSDKTITAWIPLQATPLEMGPLEFSAGSHQIEKGRDLMIGDDSETKINQTLRVTDFEHVIEAFDVGEISFHSGWIFHRAGENNTNQTRRVFTIIYMDKDMRLKEPVNQNQIDDWNTWCPGAKVDEVIDSPLNPILYEHGM